MSHNVTVSINETVYGIWRQVPHGKRSALFENLLRTWAGQYEREKYSGEVQLAEESPEERLERLEARVKAIKH